MTEYDQVIELIKKNEKTMKDLSDKHEVSKKELVLKAKDILLKNNFKMENITKKIVEDLKGYVNGSYIRSLLEAEFKNQSKANRVPQVMATDGSLVPDAQTNSTNETKEDKLKKARQEYEENKYYSGAKNAAKTVNNSMISPNVETSSNNKLTIPQSKIIPEDQRAINTNSSGEIVKSEQLAIELESDILDQIVIMRQQNKVNKVNLIIDAKTFEVVTIRASKT